MSEAIGFLGVAFTAVFVVVEPFSVVPVFASLTKGRDPEDVKRTALRASLVGAGVLVAFAFAGKVLLDALQIRVDAFRVAGGVLLLLTALDMLRAKKAQCQCGPKELKEAEEKEDIAIIPVAIPLLSGPGAMATVMMLTTKQPGAWGLTAVVLSVLATFAVAYFVLRGAGWVQRKVGKSAMAVVERVLGLVLAAMSVQFVIEGALNLYRSVAGT